MLPASDRPSTPADLARGRAVMLAASPGPSTLPAHRGRGAVMLAASERSGWPGRAAAVTARGVAVLFAAVLAGCGASSPLADSGPALPPAAEPAATLSVQAALAALPGIQVRETDDELPGYDEDAFGEQWRDVDGNGCNQRDDVLLRDLLGVRMELGSRCVVAGGELIDPYTGQRRQVEADDVGIDYVVPLRAAWEGGAARWGTSQRELLANDRGNLLAVAKATARAKGDRGADQWQPSSEAGRCLYARIVVTVHDRYALTTTRDQRDALERILNDCSTPRSTS